MKSFTFFNSSVLALKIQHGRWQVGRTWLGKLDIVFTNIQK